MRLQLTLFLTFCLTHSVISQNVGIGTLAPDASARLDINDTARGLLIPRLSLAQRDAIAAPARGLLVFVTTDSSFHYFNGTAWETLQFADTTVWKRTGNAGTNELTHFVGTTDSVSLNFRVNNQKAGRLSVSENEGTTFFGYLAGNNDVLSQSGNTFIGFQAGTNTTVGSLNTGVGYQSLLFNTTGDENSANGYQSMWYNTSGKRNTALGGRSLALNTTGTNNSAFGYRADVESENLTNATAIGSRALVAADNSLVLGSIAGVNLATASTKVGIGTTQPQAPLHVKGNTTSNIASNIRFFNAATTFLGATAGWSGTVVGYFEGNVVSTAAFIAAANNIYSDKRIKDIIGPSNGSEDLEKLRRIAITRYRYKDKWQMGDAVQTKVIAQQVKEVLPEAVSQIRNVVADVLKEARVVQRQNNTITIELSGAATVKPGVRIKCFTPTGAELYATVLSVQGSACTLDQAVEADRLFVYGTEVPDFHVVDYDAISMLNVSATQELIRRIEALEKELAALKKK